MDPRDRQYLVRSDLVQLVEFTKQHHREDGEAPHRDDDGIDRRQIGNLPRNGLDILDVGLDSNEGKLGRVFHPEAGDGREGDQPFLLQTLDTAAHRAFGDAQIGGDLAVADPRVAREDIDELAVDGVELGCGHDIRRDSMGATSNLYLTTSTAIAGVIERMPSMRVRRSSNSVWISSKSCSATRISMS